MTSKTRAVLAFLLGCAVVLSACGGKPADGTMYHCPMHPTYVSNRPGDCPICGMRLVPIEKTPTPAPESRYTCPMHPEVTSDAPGRCPKCGMDLVPASQPQPQGTPNSAPSPQAPHAGQVPGYTPVSLAAEGLIRAGVQTAVATAGNLGGSLRAVGLVVADERTVRHVQTKVSGWVEKLFVNTTGQAVRRGEPLLTLYSPELLASQEEYLKAAELADRLADSPVPEARKAATDLLAASRQRLLLFDVPETFLATLQQEGRPQRTVTLLAPISGVVTAKNAFEGERVEPGRELFTVADLSRVWVEAQIYEHEAAAVQVGTPAVVHVPSQPEAPLSGRVGFVYPTVEPQARTIRVRLEFPNPTGLLKPEMYATVEILATPQAGVLVPDSAVLDTGTRRLVFVEERPGFFVPREVTVATSRDGQSLVAQGLSPQERVAVQGTFLLDSESRLRAALAAPPGGNHDHAHH